MAITELNSNDKSRVINHPYFSENFYFLTHECYLEAIERMTNLLEPEQESIMQTSSTQSASQILNIPASSTQSVTQTSNIPILFHHGRLPRIDLPKFDGSPADWLSFKDLFNSLVLMNTSLTVVERLQYLKTSLTGSAVPLYLKILRSHQIIFKNGMH